jgi:hypothetical protein
VKAHGHLTTEEVSQVNIILYLIGISLPSHPFTAIPARNRQCIEIVIDGFVKVLAVYQ